MDLVWYNSSAIWFMVFMQATKLTNGFVHANYEMDCKIKFSILLGTQVLLFIAIINSKLHFRLQTMHFLMVIEYLFKIFLHLCLILRTALNLNSDRLDLVLESILGEV